MHFRRRTRRFPTSSRQTHGAPGRVPTQVRHTRSQPGDHPVEHCVQQRQVRFRASRLQKARQILLPRNRLFRRNSDQLPQRFVPLQFGQAMLDRGMTQGNAQHEHAPQGPRPIPDGRCVRDPGRTGGTPTSPGRESLPAVLGLSSAWDCLPGSLRRTGAGSHEFARRFSGLLRPGTSGHRLAVATVHSASPPGGLSWSKNREKMRNRSVTGGNPRGKTLFLGGSLFSDGRHPPTWQRLPNTATGSRGPSYCCVLLADFSQSVLVAWTVGFRPATWIIQEEGRPRHASSPFTGSVNEAIC